MRKKGNNPHFQIPGVQVQENRVPRDRSAAAHWHFAGKNSLDGTDTRRRYLHHAHLHCQQLSLQCTCARRDGCAAQGRDLAKSTLAELDGRRARSA